MYRPDFYEDDGFGKASEIVPGLFQSGLIDLETVASKHITAIVGLDRDWSERTIREDILVVHWSIDDSHEDWQHLSPLIWGGTVRAVAHFIHELRGLRHRVLVACAMGYNRSGLIVARSLMYDGMTPDEAIDLIREKRSPYALSNPHFTAWLQREGPSLAADLALQEEQE